MAIVNEPASVGERVADGIGYIQFYEEERRARYDERGNQGSEAVDHVVEVELALAELAFPSNPAVDHARHTHEQRVDGDTGADVTQPE